jgi:hypothetical protein
MGITYITKFLKEIPNQDIWQLNLVIYSTRFYRYIIAVGLLLTSFQKEAAYAAGVVQITKFCATNERNE